jgi:D-arabinose 1-dehydrogenase-like Zn-dependent alcohol dehydrogenase
MFWNQLTLCGTTLGNDREFLELIVFTAHKVLHPLFVSERPFEEVLGAFDRMQLVEHLGKLVLTFLEG